MSDRVTNIPITLLIEPWILLRPVVKDSVEFLEMRDSLRRNGFLNSISARPSMREKGKYEVIDGMWRRTAAIDIGLTEMPCIVKEGVSDNDVLALQIQANAIRPETTPVEFARQLRRIFDSKPGMTFDELGVIAGKSGKWVKERLNLLDLSPYIQAMVDRGEMPVASAYMLAKIKSPSIRADLLDKARTLPATEFRRVAAGAIKYFSECVRQGKLDAHFKQTFKPVAYLRRLNAVKAEAANSQEGPLLLVKEDCSTPLEGWRLALQWALNIDSQSIKQQEDAARERFTNSIEESEAQDDPS